VNDWTTQVGDAIDRMEGRLRDVGKDLFEHPELKFEEVHASKRLAAELEAAGFQVELGVAGMETAIRAVHPASSDGPTVAILGEYDALPEIGHACGHNLIAAGGLGAALLSDRSNRSFLARCCSWGRRPRRVVAARC